MRNRQPRRIITTNASCRFCDEGIDPDYKGYEKLKVFLSDRAKIVGKNRTGLCNKHQRKLSIAVKRARHLGLLPFAPAL